MGFLRDCINSNCDASSKRLGLLCLILFIMLAGFFTIFFTVKDPDSFKEVLDVCKYVICVLVVGVTAEAFGTKKPDNK